MATQMSVNYTFIPSENKVEIHGLWPLARIMLIANVTTNELIYNFSSTTKGVISHEIDHNQEVTVIVLDHDCSNMNSTDKLQIHLAYDYQYIKPEEALMDPVHKLRVSNPQNLIDTDFEYGLQSSKWETLETLNNIPSFFIGEGDTPLISVQRITSQRNSNIITVTCSEPHGLSIGTPIDVQGLSSRTAEGKFLIASTTDTTFVYKCSGIQRITGEIGSIYTTVTPGTFFTGSEIPFDPTTGLQTDAADQSVITVTTATPHGFQQGNQFYLVNTLGTKQLTLDVADASANAPDGRPFVDPLNQFIDTKSSVSALTETKSMRARHSTKFNASAVNINSNTITWIGHNLKTNDCVLYTPPSGNEEIGGLKRFNVYWVIVIDANTIQLTDTYNGNAINFTSVGQYTKGRASLHLCYEIFRSYIYRNRTYSDMWTRFHEEGIGSGWDLYTVYGESRGLGSGSDPKHILIEQVSGGTINSYYATTYPGGANITTYGGPAYTEYNFDGRATNREFVPNGENFGASGNNPGIYNFIEDFTKWEPARWSENKVFAGYFQMYKYGPTGNYNLFPSNSNWGWFIIPVVEDEEADTFYVENHGLENGDRVTVNYDFSSRGEIEFTEPGTYDWTVPDGVTSVSVVAVGGGGGGHMYSSYSLGGGGGGLGYRNNITVTPGETIQIVVGEGGRRATSYSTAATATSGGSSSFDDSNPTRRTVGGGGVRGFRGISTGSSAAGGTYVGDGGGNGGDARYAFVYCGGGGGAGGYSGDGGDSGYNTYGSGQAGTGGGGGGGGNGGSADAAGNGGGVGIYGEGTSGRGGAGSSANASNGEGGSGGEDGGRGYNLSQGSSSFVNKGGNYGGGGGAADNSGNEHGNGGSGAVRIVWPGTSRQFPSTDVAFDGTTVKLANISSTWTDTPSSFSTNVAEGSQYEVEIVNQDRFKFSGQKLYEGPGSNISFSLIKDNEKADSFYVPGHGLLSNTAVTFTVGNGGTLPTFESGYILPKATTNLSQDTTKNYFDIINTYVSDYIEGLSTVDILTSTHNGNSTRVFDTGTTNGISPIDYYDLQYTTNSVFYSQYGNFNIPNSNFYVGDLNSSTPTNILRGTILEDRNNFVMATDWSSNSSLPYYMWMRTSAYNSGEGWYGYFRDGFDFDSSPVYVTSATADNDNLFTATSGETYRWAGAWFRHNEANASHCIYIKLMFFKTTEWNNDFTNNIGFTTTQSRTSVWYSFMTNNQRQDVIEMALVFFPQTGEADLNTPAEFISFIEGLIENFDANSNRPALVSGDSYNINIISNDRFSLSSPGGRKVDLTNSGTAPFIFKTENSIGIVDGVYSTSSITENRLNIQTDVKVEGASISVDPGTIVDNAIQVAGGESHTFIPGTEVIYDSNGNPDIDGLSNGGTYYVNVVDDQFFKLSETSIEASLNTNQIAIDGANTTGTHIFTTDNIAGIIEATGTVTVTQNTNKIIGNLTLFKRYFKVGDTVYIKNSNSSPGALERYVITSISDDTIMTVDRPFNFSATNTKYFVSTKVYVRPDGYAIHRPFDGGVEIAAGTSPLSQIRRQTRKYFRYQSGKGIQTSLAINFNPPITVESLSSAVDPDIRDTLEEAIGEAVDALGYDITLGTNYNAVTTGLEQLYESSIVQNFADSIIRTEERVLSFPTVSGSNTITADVEAYFDQVNDLLTNTESDANTAVIFTEPSNATSSEINAKDRLLANRTFIIEELKAYIQEVYPNTGYNVDTFEQRMTYLINALIYDILYGGNSASYDFSSFIKLVTSDDYRNLHIGAFDRLADIIDEIVEGTSIVKTTGNGETQDISGNNTISSDGDILIAAAELIRDVMRAGTVHLEGIGDAEEILVTAESSNNYTMDGLEDPELNLVRGVTYTFNVQAPGHPFWIKTTPGTGNTNTYDTGVTNNGTDEGTITFEVANTAPNTLYYQCENHAEMVGTINVVDAPTQTYPSVTWSSAGAQAAKTEIDSNRTDIVLYSSVDTYVATVKTRYPHRLSEALSVNIKDASDSTYNGLYSINSIPDDFTFTYVLPSRPVVSAPTGIIKYTLGPYTGAAIRSGMFDDQNGFFFEFDGQTINCVRRTSTSQLSGTVSVIKGSGRIQGDNFTAFSGQLNAGDRIVIRGQTYKVSKIESNRVMYVQPEYRGVTTSGIIITKTEDIRVPQNEWSLDKCDGTGPSGFKLDITKIQMTYSDYSWYGAGKIRFGFKNQDGHVIYVHEFIHNNRLDESYMRSGNVPARYEVENGPNPQYAPTLFHWGTSVIMDGTFDDDKAYLFTAASDNLTFTNGDSQSVNTTGNSSLEGIYNRRTRTSDWYVKIPFGTADASKFYNGLPLFTAGGELNGETVAFTDYGGSAFNVYIFIQSSFFSPSSYPIVPNATAVSLAVPASGGSNEDVNLGTDIIPLVSFRLAPSVDNNLSGALGERDIINRMQLRLKEAGVIITHDCDVKLILNGDLSTVNWEGVPTPSLSELIRHQAGDTITGGTELFTFRAAGGQTDSSGKRSSNDTSLELDDIIDMGNSILGGDGIYPNGPDVLTVAVQVRDTSDISSGNPFIASARINWSESQA